MPAKKKTAPAEDKAKKKTTAEDKAKPVRPAVAHLHTGRRG